MGWDASRVTAAIPSGCGFLGAGLIWKGIVGKGKEERHEVHGLTTAAGVWLSAAIGTGCGGKLYFVTIYSCILVTMILRYGPEIYIQKDDYYNQGQDDHDGDDDDDDDMDSKSDDATPLQQIGGKAQKLKDKQSNPLSSKSLSLEGLRVSFVDHAEDVLKGKGDMTKLCEFENK